MENRGKNKRKLVVAAIAFAAIAFIVFILVILINWNKHDPTSSKSSSVPTEYSSTTNSQTSQPNYPPNLPQSAKSVTAQPLDDPQGIKYLDSGPSASPAAITPTTVKGAYSVPNSSTGAGTIAIVDAYDDPYAESDLGTFSSFYSLRSCTSANGCFEKHKMGANLAVNTYWSLEESLDVQWAHAIAPNARILVIETDSNLISDLMQGVQYALSRPDVVAVSLSWGSDEFSGETAYDSELSNTRNVAVFAAAGDSGHGVWWPAASPYVIGVGGTSLTLNGDGSFNSETAWSDGGGGLSTYETEPSFQSSYGIPSAGGMRGTPDVSYAADPNVDGFPIYDSEPYNNETGWFTIGGTSAGTPQWAALASIHRRISLQYLYSDASGSSYSSFFRDITSGSNGACGSVCAAGTGYDYVTGLGSPLSSRFY